AAKLALLLRKEGRKPGLVAADLQRPAAIDQLEQLGRQIQVPVFSAERADPVKAVEQGLEGARGEGLDTVILDTAGRLHTDAALMADLVAVRDPQRQRRGRRGAYERARVSGRRDAADERAARARRDDRPGRGPRGGSVRRASRLRR